MSRSVRQLISEKESVYQAGGCANSDADIAIVVELNLAILGIEIT